MPMLCSLRDRWTAALRSDSYTQGQHQLHADGKFCCLGVLAELVGVPSVAEHQEDEEYAVVYHYNFEEAPEVILEDFPDLPTDITSQFPPGFAGLTPEETKKLANLNDENNSFTAIADYIETNVECLPDA